MSAYTNVTINDEFCVKTSLYKEIHKIKSELEWERNLKSQYLNSLINIPRAIKEFGYVDIDYEGKIIRLKEEVKVSEVVK